MVTKKRRKCSARFLLLAAVILPTFGGALHTEATDGGTLRFVETVEKWSGWRLSDNSLDQGELVQVRLGQDADTVRAYTLGLEATAPLRIVATLDPPYRLAMDYDGDGQYEDSEVYTTAREGLEFGDFPGVRLPLRIGNATKEIRVYAQTYFWPKGSPARVYVSDIHGRYEGRMMVGGRTYQSRIVFRSPFPDKETVNEYVVLDANANGEFENVGDPWFSAQGVGYVNGRLYAAKTVFHENTAEVDLIPYNGPTGTLSWAGSGFESCLVTFDIHDPPHGTRTGSKWLMLTANEDNRHVVPTGSFTVDSLSLRDSTLPEELNRFFLLSCEDHSISVCGRVESGESLILPVGGPVIARARVEVDQEEGTVTIWDNWYEDRYGHEYRGGYSFKGGMQPGFSILDKKGATVFEGTFNWGGDTRDCSGVYRSRWAVIEWPSSASGEYAAVPVSPNPSFVQVSAEPFTIPASRPGWVRDWRKKDTSSSKSKPRKSSWWRVWKK
jgi:hypothetical protein